MKKVFFGIVVIFVLFELFVLGCRRKHVFHTFYGDIDTDTMTAIYEDTCTYYLIKQNAVDSTLSKAMGLDYIEQVIFYTPDKDLYFMKWYGSDGGSSARIYFDPYKENVDK